MTVKELKKYLRKLPDDMLMVVNGSTHYQISTSVRMYTDKWAESKLKINNLSE